MRIIVNNKSSCFQKIHVLLNEKKKKKERKEKKTTMEENKAGTNKANENMGQNFRVSFAADWIDKGDWKTVKIVVHQESVICSSFAEVVLWG